MSCSDGPVRVTSAGAWFLPDDGGAGSLLRVADGIPARAVRRIRDLGVPGLLPTGNVVQQRAQVWLRTPQPPGPSVADLRSGPARDLLHAVAPHPHQVRRRRRDVAAGCPRPQPQVTVARSGR